MTNLRDRRAAYAQRMEEALGRVVDQLSAIPGVRRVSVFGSYARGRCDLLSVLDILVILETSDTMPERLAQLYRQLDAPVDLDLVAWTPAEYVRMRDRPFGRMIAAEEQVLYEAGSDH
jgi:predicted nucleotidyltransferase